MAASLRHLPLPEPDSGRSAASSSSSGSGSGSTAAGRRRRGSATNVGGWDENVGLIANTRFTFEEASDARRSCSVSSHAVAHGSTVLGVKNNKKKKKTSIDSENNDDDDDGDDGAEWIAWDATFEPHRVCRVASNADGSVTAASTAGGTVSLMRGSDGGVLATRRVYSSEEGDDNISSLPAEVCFVSNADRHKSIVGDVLAILVPPREADDVHGGAGADGGATASSVDEFGNPTGASKSTGRLDVPYVNIILISGIDGQRLNSSDSAEVASAARTMSIDALELALPATASTTNMVLDQQAVKDEMIMDDDNHHHVVSLNACFVDKHTIRFLAVDGAGRLSAHDFDVKSKQSLALDCSENLDKSLGDGGERWTIDDSVGVRVDGDHDMYLLSATLASSVKIFFYSVSDLKLRTEYLIEGTSTKDRPKLYALESISSCDDTAAAAAIAFKPSGASADACIEVVQTIVDNEQEGVLSSCGRNTHLVFKVPIVPKLDQDIRWIDVAPATAKNTERHYSFHYKVSYNSGIGECMEFSGDEGDVVGRFRLLIAKGLFDEADTILASSGASDATTGQYGSIHGSEVALHRFRYIIDGGNVSSAESMAEAKECLRRLSAGAVAGGDLGVKCLLDASDILLKWPTAMLSSDGVHVGGDDRRIPLRQIVTRDYRIAITAMSATIAGAMNAAPPSHLTSLRAEKRRLESKIAAMRCLEQVTLNDSGQAFITPLLSDVASPADVFRSLVLQEQWVAAEQVRLSEFGKTITPEYMTSAIVGLPSHIDPRAYCSWLEETVIPGLSINHPLLAAIRTWACRTADEFDGDGNNLNLDSSITLLKTVADATARVSSTVQTSFLANKPSSYANKVDDSTSLEDTTVSSLNTSSSFHGDNNCSLPSFGKPPPPTVMQLGLLRGAPRQKGSASFTARRIQRGGNNKSISSARSTSDTSFQSINRSDVETYKIYSLYEESEVEAEIVEVKLLQAVSLKQARELGLPKRIVSLRTYDDAGGSSFIAKELVRLTSANASSDADRESKIVEGIQPFCKQSGTDLNSVLSLYTKELCDSNRNNPSVLLEAASVSRLCTGAARCAVALKVLRAALLCNEQPPALCKLSQEAIEWAVDDEMRSELEEATRLLLVDRIVRRYCGNGAQELFRVSDPRHGLRLLQFVCRHVDGASTVHDALALCDAFTHLSKADACVLILKRTALAATPDNDNTETFRSDQCASLLRLLYSKDAVLAEKVGENACIYFAEAVHDCSPMLGEVSSQYKQQKQMEAKAAAKAAIGLLSVMQENTSKLGRLHMAEAPKTMLKGGTASWATLLQKFQSVHELQTKFDIYLSICDLEKETMRDEVSLLLLRPAVDILIAATAKCEYAHPRELKETLDLAKRGISLMFHGNEEQASLYWCKTVGDQAVNLALDAEGDSRSISFLCASGLLDDLSTDTAFDTVYSVATAHCVRASKEASMYTPSSYQECASEIDDKDTTQEESIYVAMRCIIRASSILEDHALQFCPRRLLGPLVSLTSLTDAVSQVLVRGDGSSGEVMDSFRARLNEESRKRREFLPESISEWNNNSAKEAALPVTPPLHRDWYVGDGLLLPPLEALAYCMAYCKKFMALMHTQCPSTMATKEEGIYAFLNGRGAHTIALRLRASSTAIEMVSANEFAGGSSSFDMNSSILINSSDLSHETQYLAERSLGGSGSGITSGNIDSQLALAYLLSLPMKLAFKVYRACLPSAISKRDFARVIALATIGVRAGDGSSDVVVQSTTGDVVAWRKQGTFVSQCRRLASNARWWGILQNFGVAFDPKWFEGDNKSRADAYIASLVLPMIAGASKTLLRSSAALSQILNLATKFIRAYGLDEKLAAQKHVEFLLSLPSRDEESRKSSKGRHFDVRSDLKVCEKAARDTLLLLPSPMARAAILRRCLIMLETAEDCFKDYDRYASVTSLYLGQLSLVLADKSNKADFAAFQEEYECIDKRQDALFILSSFFNDRSEQERPSFPAMFLPLPTPFKSNVEKPKHKFCGVLGHESESSSTDDFDPILPLVPILSAPDAPGALSALSPLCFSLGLPTGYIHARSLHLRFKKAMAIGTALPPFDSSVRPIINRIKGSRDAAELSEWCAMRYPDGSKDRLECLELALSHAMRASSEAEQQARMHKGNDTYVNNERRALDAVKRISALKSALADRIKIETILAQGCSPSTSASSHVKLILSSLVNQVKKKNSVDSNLPPEAFVESLLLEASAMTATAVITESTCFTMDDFRLVAVAVHQACKGLADAHSHVDIGSITRRLVRRWLVHGGDAAPDHLEKDINSATSTCQKAITTTKSQEPKEKNVPSTPKRNMIKIEGDDSGEFVMNLNDLGSDGDVWSDDVGCSSASGASDSSGVVVADEEPSAVRMNGCAREVMERSNATVSLRVAFVMSFADGYHEHAQTGGTTSKGSTTTRPRRTPLTSSKPSKSLSKATRKGGTTGGRSMSAHAQGDAVLDHARELLGIAFAKKKVGNGEAAPLLSEISPSMNNASMSMSVDGSLMAKESVSQGGKVHSFAMRHRALLVATILCPHEALDYVIRSEGYGGDQPADIGKCAFASFLAMEAEAMGLQIPSSDLVHLSTMSLSSYARALWRNHGHNSNGRLLLLLLELCLRDGKNQSDIDGTFLILLLSEMTQKQLPRSLLKSLEFIASSNAASSIASVNNGRDTLQNAVKRAATLVLRDMQQTKPSLSDVTDVASDECICTLRRLGTVVTALSYEHLPIFVQMLCRFAAGTIDNKLKQEMIKIAANASCSLNEGEDRVNAFSEVIKAGGKDHLERIVSNNNGTCMSNEEEEENEDNGHRDVTGTMIHEQLFRRDVEAAAAAVGSEH